VNIFYLDRNPKIAAQMHCDKHVVKMVLEYAQILSTAHRVVDGDEDADREGLYKIAHKNHPSTAWARASHSNYSWLSDLWAYLGDEYTYRYGKIHKSSTLHWLYYAPNHIPPNSTIFSTLTPPPQCMPDEFKCNPNSASFEDTILAYKSFYMGEKSRFAKWTKRPVPTWYRQMEAA